MIKRKLHCILLKTKPWINFATVIKKEVHIFPHHNFVPD